MAEKLSYDGRVALITGAGGGLGREYALAFAERGAKVVVNDLGGDMKGEGKSVRAADQVVDEIRAKGGIAVANYDSVEDGEKVIQTALDAFGRIDILVNNAGILRDKSFARTSDLDWDLIHRVHLRGSFLVTRAAWPHMRKQNYGRIIMTTSAAGLYGNFGQANYSAAKLGLVGLSNTLAKEGEKYNIQCNSLAPIAGSRLTATVMPPDVLAALKPEFVAPVVLWLCHEACTDSGNIIECGAGYVAKVQMQKSKGAVARQKGKKFTPEQVRDSWEKASDFTEFANPRTTADSNAVLYQLMGELDEGTDSGPTPNPVAGKTTPDAAVGFKLPENDFTFEGRDAMLYALGVGVSTSQPDFLKFLFELNEGFCTLPSYGAIIGQCGLHGLVTAEDMPVSINPTMILHGEQYLELFKPLPTSGKLRQKATVVDVLDKGKGAVFIMDVDSYDESGEKVLRNQSAVYVQRMGGWGGRRSSPKQVMPLDPPNRAPDASMEEKTGSDQAAIYRLSGDYNPLHIDPDFAAMGGFDRPILHGLCSFGYAARHVLKAYCDNDVTKFKAIKVRFTKPVLPGQTLKTDMWREGNRIFFQTKVVENGNVCLSGAYVDLHSVVVSKDTTADETSTDILSSGDLMSDVIFSEIARRVGEDADLVKKVKAIYLWHITKDGKTAATWTVDLKNGVGSVYRGEPKEGKAGVTITLADQDFVDLVSGKLNGQQAFFNGKLKVKGNVMLTMKMEKVFKDHANL